MRPGEKKTDTAFKCSWHLRVLQMPRPPSSPRSRCSELAWGYTSAERHSGDRTTGWLRAAAGCSESCLR